MDKNSVQFIFEGSANLKRGFEGVGGRLYLSHDYILFKPHRLNIQNEEVLIYLKEVGSISKAKSLGIIPNSFIIRTPAAEYKFMVKKRDEWIKRIESQIQI